MHNYTQHVWLLVKRFILLILLYFISRLFFYILNASYFNDISFLRLSKDFIYGTRFDIAAIVFTNFFMLAFLVPGTYKNHKIALVTADILFFTINSVAILSNLVDSKFFDFINKRSTTAIFSLMSGDTGVWKLIPRFMRDYWYIALSWVFLLVVMWKLRPVLPTVKLVREKMTLKSLGKQSAIFIFVALLMVLGARGTKLKPIGMADAASYTELKCVPLLINTPFSLIKTVENENLSEVNYYTPEELKKIYSPIHNNPVHGKFRKMNVVIFILESFSKEYCGYLGGLKGFTPNLDSILDQSLVFTNAYANGTQSYEAMPAIIAGIPSLMDRPYSGSNYADNIIESLPGLLKSRGYQASFFHGGNNGTMNFENFAHIAGIENYYGRKEYNDDRDYDGHWGIWDEPFLGYYARKLDSFREPFFSAVFTLSSHHPYSIPDKYAGKFRKGDLPVLQTIAYADFALGEFFKTACKMDWYNNTLFVFTADHAAQAINQTYNSTTGMFAIPIAFFSPSDSSLRGRNSETAQQIDIMPSVLDYLHYEGEYFAFGESLLNNTITHRSISYVNGVYQLIEDENVMQFDGKNVIAFYKKSQEGKVNLAVDPGGNSKEFGVMESHLKAILQTYKSCLIHNRMSVEQNMKATGENSF
ncbi:MAG TPA: sulfatase-like hydrolase/transferase [Bacteroidales bacterium]|nr:sulfatase-like hydrolase/transferase [Bacteroidales bacterium]